MLHIPTTTILHPVTTQLASPRQRQRLADGGEQEPQLHKLQRTNPLEPGRESVIRLEGLCGASLWFTPRPGRDQGAGLMGDGTMALRPMLLAACRSIKTWYC